MPVSDEVTKTAQDYYNSDSADYFYHTVWGGEDIHIGLYSEGEPTIREASERTVAQMADALAPLPEGCRILDIGAGYGGAARYLAKRAKVQVDCLNLSEVQNERSRELNAELGLSGQITVHDGSFEDIPAEAESYDIVWSQDAILHSGNRRRVFEEVDRVLRPGGKFIFTDPMAADDCPEGVLDPILARIHLSSLGSPGFYRRTASELGWKETAWQDLTHELVNHYSAVRGVLRTKRDELVPTCGEDYVTRMDKGLGHWVDGGRNGHLAWGILLFQK